MRERLDNRDFPDERSASFYAMGISQATNKPVAVICTSGSAAANLSPALAEAFYQEIVDNKKQIKTVLVPHNATKKVSEILNLLKREKSWRR